METALYFRQMSYTPAFIKRGMTVYENHHYLYNNTVSKDPKWTLYLSVITIEIVRLLDIVLPFIKQNQVNFQIIKSDLLHYKLNAGMNGEDQIGKVISIYPESAGHAIELARVLNLLTGSFNGPLCSSALRIGKILYAENGKTAAPVDYPIEKQYRKKKKNRIILGRFYVAVEAVKRSFKGNIYKAVSFKGLKLRICIVKEGKPFALDDQFGREVKDRLLWQRTIIKDLENDVVTPSYYDYFEENGHSFLVMQHAEGVTLFEAVRNIYKGKNWKSIDKVQRRKLIKYFLNVLTIVRSIHNKGYVQRDISDSNFLVMPAGDLCIIDFELSYSMSRKEPAHPFLLGTFGYAAPEQLKYAVPDYKEDIYSLGAMLCFILTGIPPVTFIGFDLRKVSADLMKVTGDRNLNKIILSCLSHQRSERPAISKIEKAVLAYMDKL